MTTFILDHATRTGREKASIINPELGTDVFHRATLAEKHEYELHLASLRTIPYGSDDLLKFPDGSEVELEVRDVQSSENESIQQLFLPTPLPTQSPTPWVHAFKDEAEFIEYLKWQKGKSVAVEERAKEYAGKLANVHRKDSVGSISCWITDYSNGYKAGFADALAGAKSVGDGRGVVKEHANDWNIPVNGVIHVPDELDIIISKVATQIRFHTISGKSEEETVADIVFSCQIYFSSLDCSTPSDNWTRVEALIKKYETYISNVEWHTKFNNPPKSYIEKAEQRISDWKEVVKDLKTITQTT